MAYPLENRLKRLGQKMRLWSALYFLMLPTILAMAVFNYYPKLDAIVMSMYRWQPPNIQEYVGLSNFIDALNDPMFWQSFKLVCILLVANLLKMWPGILAAVALHRILSDRWRYIYQVLFVVPMVIPALVWLLIWKSFYDPHFGLLNQTLNSTGLIKVLQVLDGSAGAPGLMPRIAQGLEPVFDKLVDPVFGNVWGVLLFGAMVTAMAQRVQARGRRWIANLFIMLLSLVPYGFTFSPVATSVFAVVILFALARTLGARWILWLFILLAGAAAFWRYPLHFSALVAALIVITELLSLRLDRDTMEDVSGWGGVGFMVAGAALVMLGKIWILPTGQFLEGTPAWLGHRDLVVPAIIMWGFPWVGTVGVLIYLSGLQQISKDVYEAAELDGVGPIGKLFKIELPLIMTQVRINLIFMTIHTLTAYQFFLILFGSNGGPGNRGMVPGLYMFKKAFEEGRFGYACSLGMVLFVMILLLTVVYNKYVKVEK